MDKLLLDTKLLTVLPLTTELASMCKSNDEHKSFSFLVACLIEMRHLVLSCLVLCARSFLLAPSKDFDYASNLYVTIPIVK